MRANTDKHEALMRRVTVSDRGCWERSGANVKGYPVVKIRGRQYRAARLAYELLVGPIPKGLTIDHVVCRNITCINPDHMEPVTNAENARRMQEANRPTHCPHGHIYDERNSYDYRGRRHCRTCRNARSRAYQRARRSRALTGRST